MSHPLLDTLDFVEYFNTTTQNQFFVQNEVSRFIKKKSFFITSCFAIIGTTLVSVSSVFGIVDDVTLTAIGNKADIGNNLDTLYPTSEHLLLEIIRV